MRVSLLLLAALLGANAFAQSTPLPIEHFARWDEFGGIKISPDGKYLALLTGDGARTTLAFVDLQNGKVDSAVHTQHGSEIYSFRWLSPGRILAMTGRRYSELLPPSLTNNAFAVERDGRQRVSLNCCLAYVHWSLPVYLRIGGTDLLSVDDAGHILVAEHPMRSFGIARRTDPHMKPSVVSIDTYTGRSRHLEIVPLRGAQLLTDRAGKVRFALGLNEHSRFAISWKPQADAAWSNLYLKELRNDSVLPRRFSHDGRSVFLTGVREGETFAALYRLDLPTQNLERVHAFADADVEDVITDFADRDVVGVRGHGDRWLEHWLQPDDPSAQAYQALHRAFPGQRVSLTSATSDGSKAVVLVDSDTNPGDYYLFDTATRKAEFLRAARAWIDPKQMRPKEPIALQARDGLQLHGYVTRPAGDGPRPMVVFLYSGPYDVRDTWRFDWEVQLLASRGYAILQVNFRGSPGYGLDFQRAAQGEWGGKVQDDIADATLWAISQGIASAERVCIYGKFYGGYAALMGVIREPDLYRCAIGYDGVYDLELAHSQESAHGGKTLELAFGSEVAQRRARSPALDARSIRSTTLNPQSIIAQSIKAPILLIYGEPAWYVDAQHAAHMRKTLEKTGKKVETLPVMRHSEQLYDDKTRRGVYERILQFLAANIGS
jgi:dipeptidyl aminopeptidase/acylaminoacyl peptidase